CVISTAHPDATPIGPDARLAAAPPRDRAPARHSLGRLPADGADAGGGGEERAAPGSGDPGAQPPQRRRLAGSRARQPKAAVVHGEGGAVRDADPRAADPPLPRLPGEAGHGRPRRPAADGGSAAAGAGGGDLPRGTGEPGRAVPAAEAGPGAAGAANGRGGDPGG